MEGTKAKDEVALSVAIDASAAKEDAGHKRASRSRLAAMIGGLALVGAAVGLVGVGLSNSADSSTTKAAAPSYSADLIGAEVVTAAGVKGGPARGKADLDVHNVLTWALRKLEPETSGTIHLHAGTSCNALGSSHWDTEVTSSNPWTEVTWSSDSAGKSEGTLNIDELVGAYSFPANLRHAVVFYSHDQQVLACGLLKPEGDYRKFGVQSVLNNGFEEHQSNAVAGEVILSKANVLSWGVYNLQAKQSGVMSVLAGRDCSNPDATRFTTEWSTDKWGTSRSEAAIDSADHDFSDLVGRAVVIRNAQGAVVACNTLSVFVEKTPEAFRAIRAELQDIVDTYKSDGSHEATLMPTASTETAAPTASQVTAAPTSMITLDPTTLNQAFAELDAFPDLAIQCRRIGQEALSSAAQIHRLAGFLAINQTAYESALDAVSNGAATEVQLELISSYESALQSKTSEMILQQGLQQLWDDTCVKSTECNTLFGELERDGDDKKQAVLSLEEKAEEFDLAVAAIADGSATPEQIAVATEYHTLTDTVASFNAGLDARVDELDAACLPNVICSLNYLHKRCTKHQFYDGARYGVAGSAVGRADNYLKRSEMQVEYQAALIARQNGTATTEQQDVIDLYGRLTFQKSRSATSAARRQRVIRYNDPTPSGNITLSGQNVLSWQIQFLPFNQTGHIMIHEGTSCEELGGQAALEGTTPYTSVFWDTTGPSSSDNFEAVVEGSVDLSKLDGALPFSSNYPRAVVVYSAEMDQVSCGILKLR